MGADEKEACPTQQRKQGASWPPFQTTTTLSSRNVVQSSAPSARRASGKPFHWRVLKGGGSRETRQQELSLGAQGARVTRLPSGPSHARSLAPPPSHSAMDGEVGCVAARVLGGAATVAHSVRHSSGGDVRDPREIAWNTTIVGRVEPIQFYLRPTIALDR